MARKPWGTDEIERLRGVFPTKPNKDLAELFDRSIASITNKAKELGLHKSLVNRASTNKKTLESVNIELKDKYPKLELLEYLGMEVPTTILDTRCNHTWKTRPSYPLYRDIGITCPICNSTSRKRTSSDFKDIVLAKFRDIIEVGEYTNSTTRCKVGYSCGHSYDIVPADLLNKGAGSTCRICNAQGYNLKSHEEFIAQAYSINDTIKVLEEYAGDSKYILVGSELCEHTWYINPHNFLAKASMSNCPICCSGINQSSKAEEELYEFIKSNYNGWIIRHDRDILSGKELDIVLPDLGIAIEYNGVYWHSTINKPDKMYHASKTNEVEHFEYRLIHIMEDEWVQKKEIVKSRLLGILNKHTSIFARKCYIEELPFGSIKEFLEVTHLQGAGSPTKHNLALKYNGEIVAVMTFSKPRFTTNVDLELVRFSSKLNTRIVGGASKLFKYFLKNVPEGSSIISYSDRRWNSGGIYTTLGFTYSHTSAPGYHYYSASKDRLSRYACQKHLLIKLFPKEYSEELTEEEIMRKAGFHKVYDSGNKVFIFNK